jgi:predicted Rossmann-fold nucleotide-binding protein
MAQLKDTFVVLPGGFGTLEELVTLRMWLKLAYLPYLCKVEF